MNMWEVLRIVKNTLEGLHKCSWLVQRVGHDLTPEQQLLRIFERIE